MRDPSRLDLLQPACPCLLSCSHCSLLRHRAMSNRSAIANRRTMGHTAGGQLGGFGAFEAWCGSRGPTFPSARMTGAGSHARPVRLPQCLAQQEAALSAVGEVIWLSKGRFRVTRRAGHATPQKSRRHWPSSSAPRRRLRAGLADTDEAAAFEAEVQPREGSKFPVVCVCVRTRCVVFRCVAWGLGLAPFSACLVAASHAMVCVPVPRAWKSD